MSMSEINCLDILFISWITDNIPTQVDFARFLFFYIYLYLYNFSSSYVLVSYNKTITKYPDGQDGVLILIKDIQKYMIYLIKISKTISY